MFAVKVSIEVYDSEDFQKLALAERSIGVVPPNGAETDYSDMLLLIAATAEAEASAAAGMLQEQLRDQISMLESTE